MADQIPKVLLPISPSTWPPALADLEADFAGNLNVYRTMAHHPALVRAWTALRQHIVLDTALGRERSEVVILRAAHNLNSSYEWAHHLSRARKLGLSDQRIGSMRGTLSLMEPEDAIIARAVDEVVKNARLTPETLQALNVLVGKEATLDLFATVGFYSTLAFIVNTFDTPLDEAVSADISGHPLAPHKDTRP